MAGRLWRQAEVVTSASKRLSDAHDGAFRALFEDHVSYIHASLSRLGVRDADLDDLALEVFVRVHRQLSEYDKRRQVRPWLFGFAVRVASEYRRRPQYRREVLDAAVDMVSDLPAPDHEVQQKQARAIVNGALEALDFDKRTVFVLFELDETPVPEIARVLGIPEGTVYSRLRAARTEITAALRRQQRGEKRTRDG
jgi:RNA polymerase sigma-70 factor (ECF subfamily)